MTQNKTELSIIVCTFNRSEYLPQCLDSLFNQTASGNLYEVIVVDNNSSDNTCEVVKKYTDQNTHCRYFFEPEQGLSYARNLGLQKAASDYIAYIDDESRAKENWVEVALEIIKEKTPDIFGGSVQPIFPDGKPAWFKDEYGVRGDMGETGWITKGFIIGSNIFFKKSLLQEYGGFDIEAGMKGNQISYHEETLLAHRAFKEGKRVFFSKELDVFDLIPDFKKSVLFFIYAKYKAGKDGEKLWNPQYSFNHLQSLLKLIDDTFDELNYALLMRDQSLYQYPENYVIEKIRNNFLKIGMQIQFFLKNNIISEHTSKMSDQYETLKMEYESIRSELEVLQQEKESSQQEIQTLRAELKKIKKN